MQAIHDIRLIVLLCLLSIANITTSMSLLHTNVHLRCRAALTTSPAGLLLSRHSSSIRQYSSSLSAYTMSRSDSNDTFASQTANRYRFEGYQQPSTKHEAFVKAKEFNQHFPAIILVNPFLDQNVGSVARCMMNYGLTELRIVDPVCDVTSEHCKALSVGAYSIVENAKIFKTAEEAISDLTRVMATTDRTRHMNQLVVSPAKAAEIAFDRSSPTIATSKVGIMFGRERNGLNNEELALADTMVTIPTFNHFSSLNLAQAVNIIGYEMWKRHCTLQETAPPDLWLQPKDGSRLVRREELDHFFSRLEHNLNIRDFQVEPLRRATSYRDIRNIFRRTMLAKTEVDLLQGVLTALLRSPKELPTDQSRGEESK